MLTDCLGVPHVSTGDMLRERIRHGDDLGNGLAARVAAKMHSGLLVSDPVVNQMVEERLSKPDAADGFVLDGYPRTLDQAQHLDQWLERRGICEVVIHLAVDYNVIIARLTGRRQCPRCGTLYNMASHPPSEDSLCDKDGVALVVREDDSETVIRERLDAYERQTRPVLEYYASAHRRVVKVDSGNDPPEVVFQKICQALDKDDC